MVKPLALETPIVIVGGRAAMCAAALLNLYQATSVEAVALLVADCLSPLAIGQAIARGAGFPTTVPSAVSPSGTVQLTEPVLLVAIPDTVRSYSLREFALERARIALFSDNGSVAFITKHPTPSAVGSLVNLDGHDARLGMVPQILWKART